MVLNSSFFDEDHDLQKSRIHLKKTKVWQYLWVPNGEYPSPLLRMIPFNFWIACMLFPHSRF